MGLDMTMYGSKFLGFGAKTEQEDGHNLVSKEFELAYWRKHPNLHGFIVQTFGKGDDNCERISLEVADIKQILEAVKDPENLPETSGFFFGKSYSNKEEAADDVKQLTAVLKWLETKEERVYRDVYYRASW